MPAPPAQTRARSRCMTHFVAKTGLGIVLPSLVTHTSPPPTRHAFITGLAYDSDASVSSVDSSSASDKPLVRPHQKFDKRRAASAERAPRGSKQRADDSGALFELGELSHEKAALRGQLTEWERASAGSMNIASAKPSIGWLGNPAELPVGWLGGPPSARLTLAPRCPQAASKRTLAIRPTPRTRRRAPNGDSSTGCSR